MANDDVVMFYRYALITVSRNKHKTFSTEGHDLRFVLAVQRHADGIYRVAMSFCSANDRFVRDVGRKHAMSRLASDNTVVVTQHMIDTYKGIVPATLHALHSQFHVKPWWIPQDVWMTHPTYSLVRAY